jgi:glycosyltransferase involved in cell wall biosynthesis
MKTFLLFDGLGQKNEFIFSLINVLADDGFEPLLSARAGSPLTEKFKEKNWRHKVYWPLGGSFWFLTVAAPVLGLVSLIRLFFYKRVFKVEAVVCLGWNAKFLMTVPARLLGLKVVWLELPNFDYEGLGKTGLKFYRAMAGKIKLVCFSLTTKLALLALEIPEDSLVLIWPGIEASEFQNQINLFQNIARENYNLGKKKFFTIGTIIDFKEAQRTEVLMRAVKEIIVIEPNSRLIVIGDGPAREQAEWLSRKLGLEKSVWLVGSQTDLKKWYANFDVFVVGSVMPGLDDFLVALAAMINGVPVIAPQGLSLEDCFLGGKAGILLPLDNPEELSATIIKLKQDAALWKNFSNNARRVAKDFFALSRAKDEFKTVLNK